ncbi:FMN-binding protein [Microbacterium sp. CH12i]|uniref:FMN-binding protein n=1 Tax=Microbacterium sp. CH12i TaxID=1479651 RepID=UPI000ACC5F56|nr:FMN-binding protein [Microbacterium sp. CH12i]
MEKISVTLTLEGGVVTEVNVTGDPQARETEQYQGAFIDGIAEEVVGVAIDDLNVSRVAGSSLTSGGFNSALDAIKEQATV